jgi:seryl-tRNA synthetase
MISIHLLREMPETVQTALKNRNSPEEIYVTLDKIIDMDKEWRAYKKEEEELRAERNKLSLEIVKEKKAGKQAVDLIKRSADVSDRIKEIGEKTKHFDHESKELLMYIPNIPDQSVPMGTDESANKEIRVVGEPKKTSKDILSHYDLAHQSEMIDFERGAKLAGHRFTVLRGDVAKLERALIHFMLNVQTQQGYTEILPPFMINTKAITGTGQLPKFEFDQYKIKDEDLWLVPTAEVPLTNLYSDEVLDEEKLPIKLTAYTPCFRREAGEYGKDIRGLIRQHQFNKVELVKLAHPDRSFDELESMTKDAEKILELLELPYRVVELCTGDLGFSAAKTYDIEVWIPSQDKYREISSCSNCTDFQSRRANLKFRDSKGALELVHTLNGSGLAVGRTLIAILENFQEDKKTVVIPKVLREYMGTDTIQF